MVFQVEQRRIIPEFTDYEVTSFGRVFNIATGREMALSPTMQGDLTVGLMLYGRQYRRSVKVLVAEAFVPGKNPIFDTPIQLDGNKENLDADNMAWRPRWFAIMYRRQFTEPHAWHYGGPVVDLDNHIEYPDIYTAARTTGSLCEDIRMSIFNETRVFPDGQRYIFRE